MMQQFRKSGCLVLQPYVFFLIIPMNVLQMDTPDVRFAGRAECLYFTINVRCFLRYPYPL